MKVTPRRATLDARQYIYPSSGPHFAVMLGGIFDPTDNSVYVLTPEGVQQAMCGRHWFLLHPDDSVTVATREDVLRDFEPVDWVEAKDTLGGTDWPPSVAVAG